MRLTRRQFSTLLPVLGGTFAGASTPEAVHEPGEPTLTLLMAGDIMLDGLPGASIAQGIDVFADFASLLTAADVTVGNLECAVGVKGARLDKKYTFQAHPRVVPVLARYFDAVSLANNHSGDFGKEALVECLELLDAAWIGHFGAGHNLEEAHRPWVVKRRGIKLALLGYDEFKPQSFEAGPDTPGVAWSLGDRYEARVMADIRRAKDALGADVVIPFLHWGWENEPHNVRQESFAHRMIDAGADIVVGGHPHVTQSFELYKGKLIVYSLGNFVFDEFEGRTGWLLRLTISTRGLVRWETIVLETDAQGTPHLAREFKGPAGSMDRAG
jgi:poly-gamma-glutamate synthesis protein (capsule biosynthesis protein)